MSTPTEDGLGGIQCQRIREIATAHTQIVLDAVKDKIMNLATVIATSYENKAGQSVASFEIDAGTNAKRLEVELPAEMVYAGFIDNKMICIAETEVNVCLSTTTLHAKVENLSALILGQENLKKYALCPTRLQNQGDAQVFPPTVSAAITEIIRSHDKGDANCDEKQVREKLKKILNKQRSS